MDLEKYKSAIEEYVDSYKQTWTKLQQQGVITKDILNYKLENLKKEIEHFLEFNEPYGQLLLRAMLLTKKFLNLKVKKAMNSLISLLSMRQALFPQSR